MAGVRGKAFQTIGDQLAQRTDVLICGRKYTNGNSFCGKISGRPIPEGSLRQSGAVRNAVQKRSLCRERRRNPCADRIIIKVYIRNRGKKVFNDPMIHTGIDRFSFRAKLCRHRGKSFRRPDQQILQRRRLRAFSTDTGLGAAGAACGFLTLVAKHFLFHR